MNAKNLSSQYGLQESTEGLFVKERTNYFGIADNFDDCIFHPCDAKIHNWQAHIRDYTRKGKVKILIPLRDLNGIRAKVVRETIEVLKNWVDSSCIIVSENGVHKTVSDEVKASGARSISVESVGNRIDWERFLKIVNLHKLEFGKGFAVFGGLTYLAIEQSMNNDDWIVQCDADISDFERFQLVQYLFYPIIAKPSKDWQYLKIAKRDRNNESINAGINGLAPYFMHQISRNTEEARIAHEIYTATIHHIWILSGQFALRWQHALNRMFTTGYCDELFVSAQHGWRFFAQSYNPNPCVDQPNTKSKEDCMLIRIQQFLNALVVFGKSVRQPWAVEDIVHFNKFMIPNVNSIVRIPDEDKGICIESFETDRIIPSIQCLLDEGIIKRA